jgi:hypothetical protein
MKPRDLSAETDEQLYAIALEKRKNAKKVLTNSPIWSIIISRGGGQRAQAQQRRRTNKMKGGTYHAV